MGGFKKFLLRGNLIELSVAVVIGVAFGDLVKSLVTSFITPLIALVGGQPDYTDLGFTLGGTRFPFGIFLTAVVSFLIIAAVVYFLIVLPVSKLMERLIKAEEATTHDCPRCLSEIPIKATRCKYCTSEIPAPAPAAV